MNNQGNATKTGGQTVGTSKGDKSHPFVAGEVRDYGGIRPETARSLLQARDAGVDFGLAPDECEMLREQAENPGTPDPEASRERKNRLTDAAHEAFRACGIGSPRELAEEIGCSERAARNYFNDPTTITEWAYQKMLGSERLGLFVLAARFGADMEYARLYATAEPVFDPEMVEMTRHVIRSFLRLSKEDMSHLLAVADAFAASDHQSVGERATCNYIRGKVSEPGFVDMMSELDFAVINETESATDFPNRQADTQSPQQA